MLGNVQKLNDLGKALWGGMGKTLHSKIRVMHSCIVTIRCCENTGTSRLVKTAHSESWLKWLRLINVMSKTRTVGRGRKIRQQQQLPGRDASHPYKPRDWRLGAFLCADALWGEHLWFCCMQPYVQRLKLWLETLKLESTLHRFNWLPPDVEMKFFSKSNWQQGCRFYFLYLHF